MESSTWEILLPAELDPAGPNELEDITNSTYIDEYDDRSALLKDADRFDAIITRIGRIDEELITHATNLEIISKHGVGIDNIDVPAASENGVIVTNTPGVNSRAVAEHTITLILAVRRRLLEADRNVRSGRWENHNYVTNELRNNILGLFGYGDIGREVANLASSIGMSCVTYDPYVDASDLPEHTTAVSAFEDLFDRADIVSIHTPLTPETEHAISDAQLSLMSSSDILINTARAEVVDEGALISALEDGTIGGAGIDVFSEEPPAQETPLFDCDNVILTPHIGAQTTEALRNASVESARNVRAVYNGTIPETAINCRVE